MFFDVSQHPRSLQCIFPRLDEEDCLLTLSSVHWDESMDESLTNEDNSLSNGSYKAAF